MFSGIGGLDLAAEFVFRAHTVWQLDRVGERCRRRHWPATQQVVADVTCVDPSTLAPVDVLTAGFPCQDLSVAGPMSGRAGLAGERSGLYAHVLRFTATMMPRFVVIENVPGLLSRFRSRVEADFAALGYGLRWVKARALDAGAPHVRNRVFVVAELGSSGCSVATAPRDGCWSPVEDELERPTPTPKLQEYDALRPWPTATAINPNEGEGYATWRARSDALVAAGSRPLSEPLGLAVRPWPTATAGDARASGSRCLSDDAHPGTSLTDAVRADRAAVGSVGCGEHTGMRLNPAWVSQLMGYPPGWADPTQEDQIECDMAGHRWPRGRYPAGWDRTQPWGQYPHEEPRVLPPGRMPGRPAWLRALGNAVVPQQAALAIRTALEVPDVD